MIILAMVGIAVVLIFFFSGTAPFAPSGEEIAGNENSVIIPGMEEDVLIDFKPTENPFYELEQARNNNEPIVLEFYARW